MCQTLSVPNILMRKLKYREVKKLAQVHVGRKSRTPVQTF
jgi:hypothetical protein